MINRFASNFLLLLIAGFQLVACFAFSNATLAALGLGTAAATILISLIGFALAERGPGQRALDILLALTGGWLVVSARVLPLAAQKWLTFGAAALIAALAAAGLILREAVVARLAAAGRRDSERVGRPHAGLMTVPAAQPQPLGPLVRGGAGNGR